MNLEKLTPAPWEAEKTLGYTCCNIRSSPGWNLRGPEYNVFHLPSAGRGEEEGRADAAFIALARNAFDVMMRRGWHACRSAHSEPRLQWFVDVPTRKPRDGGSVRLYQADPFTALVEADRWYRENVE